MDGDVLNQVVAPTHQAAERQPDAVRAPTQMRLMPGDVLSTVPGPSLPGDAGSKRLSGSNGRPINPPLPNSLAPLPRLVSPAAFYGTLVPTPSPPGLYRGKNGQFLFAEGADGEHPPAADPLEVLGKFQSLELNVTPGFIMNPR